MVFVRPSVSAGEMKPPLGFAFACSRLVARLGGREVRRAKWSGLEAYSVCLLVFGISWVYAARAIPLVVRPFALQIVIFVTLPVLLWLIHLLLYYLISLGIRLLRRLGLYSAPTNDPIQHLFFILLTTFLSLSLLQSEAIWLESLGGLWLALIALNLLSIVIEKFFGRA
jgi:hypothetical protein